MPWATLAAHFRPQDSPHSQNVLRERRQEILRIKKQGHLRGFALFLNTNRTDLPRTKYQFRQLAERYAQQQNDPQTRLSPDPYCLRVAFGNEGYLSWRVERNIYWTFKNVARLCEILGADGDINGQRVRESKNLRKQAGMLYTGNATGVAGGIRIIGNPRFGNVVVGRERKICFRLINMSRNKVTLTRIESKSPTHVVASGSRTVFATSLPLGDCRLPIRPRSGRKVEITFRPEAPFIEYRELIFFEFDGGAVTHGRYLRGVGMPSSRETRRILLPRSRYRPRVRTHFSNIGPVEEPPAFQDKGFTWPRMRLLVPQLYGLRRMEDINVVLKLHPKLTAENYMSFMSALIHAEENQLITTMKYYDLPHARFTQEGNLFILVVPGLAEKRPSILYGDRILVRRSGAMSSEAFKGRVRMIERDQIRVMFGPRFMASFVSNMTFHVRFEFSRLPAIRQHDAIYRFPVMLPTTFLFPRSDTGEKRDLPKLGRPIDFFQKYLNRHQKLAVERIIRGNINNDDSDSPYIIFGPPGTGKTVTLVESILQLRERYKFSRNKGKIHILATAPSNTAADLVAERLLRLGQIPKSEVFRLNSISRNHATLHESLVGVSCMNEERQFALPSLKQLREYTVIVATNISSARLHDRGLESHFDFIFIDEAGQATEAETLSSFVTLWKRGHGRVVLCGDPRQLGPVIRCRLSEKRGLGISLMERLMRDCDRYKSKIAHGKVEWNDRYITKLIDNYRSHPALLKVPSQLFYSGELMEAADPVITRSLIKFSGLPNKRDFPFIFHSVAGEDEREENSPSFFNAAEALIISNYIEKLLTERRLALTEKHIGIITPYRKQVEKIRILLRACGYPKVRVSSCEEFQGQESRIIIVSTVRSSKEFEEFDRRYNLGFVRSPKRMNVAITRAQALLIVVGNPDVLVTSENWRALIKYAVDNGAYTGNVPVPQEVWDSDTEDEEGDNEEVDDLKGITERTSMGTEADAELKGGTENIDVGAIEMPARIEE